jgi:hypothetical protein
MLFAFSFSLLLLASCFLLSVSWSLYFVSSLSCSLPSPVCVYSLAVALCRLQHVSNLPPLDSCTRLSYRMVFFNCPPMIKASLQSQFAAQASHGSHPNHGTLARDVSLALCSLLSALCSLLSALCSLLSALCSLLSALCSLLSALCSLLSALCSLLSAL